MDLITDYLESLSVSENTMISYSNDLKKFRKFIDEKELDVKSVEKRELRDFQSYLSTEYKLSDTTIIKIVNTVKRMYKYLDTEDLVEDNPTSLMKKPREPQRVPKYLEKSEIEQLRKQVSSNQNKFYRYRNELIVDLFIMQGLRLSELTGLKLSDIRGNTISIIGKGDKERLLAMTDTVKKALNKYLSVRPSGKSVHLITNINGQSINNRAIQKMIKNELVKVGLGHHSVHSLRHTFATLMSSEGVDIRGIQELLGHSSIATTQIYAGVTMENKERMNNILESAVGR